MPVVRLMNEGKMDEAAALFLKPSMATNMHDEYRQGLALRRQQEHDIFTNGEYGDIGWVYLYHGNPSDGNRERYDIKENDL